MSLSRRGLSLAAASLAVAGSGATVALAAGTHQAGRAPARQAIHAGHHRNAVRAHDEWGSGQDAGTTTPIKHVVVIFQENVSFDHYFGTYPHAANSSPGEPSFSASPDTPSVNGLTPALLTHNPNTYNPQRLSRSEAVTCDQDHDYTAEQDAFDHGLMDRFVQSTDTPACPGTIGAYQSPGLVMDYYDGNTVTGLWNYAQHFAMSDNSYGTTFGPSTPGALNLISGQTHGATSAVTTNPTAGDSVAGGSVIGDPDPAYDACSGATRVSMSGRNIGNLLNDRGVTWGWFEGGFAPTSAAGAPVKCGSSHANIAGAPETDYSPHHEPFQYYASTANPQHLPPSSVAKIGYTDQANHQYDLTNFWQAVDNGTMPAVSFLKAARYQDGHPGNSDPLDEQHFLVETINRLERTKDWKSTAVIINYDDSDGWYDHQMSTILNQSTSAADTLTDPGQCGNGAGALGGYQDRCGYGPRLPLMVISPYAKVNSVDNTLTDQSSVLRFIEDNWGTGQIGDGSFDALAGPLTNMFSFGHRSHARTLFLDPTTGQPVGPGREGNARRG